MKDLREATRLLDLDDRRMKLRTGIEHLRLNESRFCLEVRAKIVHRKALVEKVLLRPRPLPRIFDGQLKAAVECTLACNTDLADRIPRAPQT
jgi:hypothetical protein